MVEPLKQLNEICQKPRYREVGNWMVRHILRDAALPITWLLLHTEITANQVTLISLLIAILGIVFLGIPSNSFFLTGALLLQLWYLLDHVDGQVARYRKTSSLSGRFFDFVMHHIVHASIFFGLSYYNFERSGSVAFLIFGFVVSISIMTFNLIHDTKYKTFFEQLKSLNKSFKLSEGDAANSPVANGNKGIFRKIFSWLHKSCEVHVLINVITVVALIQFIVVADLRFVLFLLYGFIVPAITAVKMAFLVINRRIDREFESEIETLKS